MAKKQKDIRSFEFKLQTTTEAKDAIDKKILLMQRLYAYIVGEIRDHIEYLKKRTDYGQYCEELCKKAKEKYDLECQKRQLNKDIPEENEQIKAINKQIKKVKEESAPLFRRKDDFFANNPVSLVRFRMDSHRALIHLQSDIVTPVDGSDFELKYSVYDHKPYYVPVGKDDIYTIVPGSVHPEYGGYKASICECRTGSIPAVFNEEKKCYEPKERVWLKDCINFGPVTKVNKDTGKESVVFDIVVPVELFRIDDGSNEYNNFCSKFSSERVYSIKRNKNIKNHTQKTQMRYVDYGFKTRDLMYILGPRLFASFQEFPLERKHRTNEHNILTSSDVSTMIDVVKENDSYVLLLKTTFGKMLRIPVIECAHNKGRLHPLLNYDRMLLDTSLATKFINGKKKCSYTILRERIRSKVNYFLKIVLDEETIPERPLYENSLNQRLGQGPVGVDPNAHMIAGVGDYGRMARIFSLETIDNRRVYLDIQRNTEEIERLKSEMNKSLAGCNPKAIDEKGRYIKGCGLKLFKSKKFLTMKAQQRELYRKNTELKKYVTNCIAHELLLMGNVVYSELPEPKEKAERKPGVKQNENGRYESNHGNGRSVQTFAIAGMINEVRRIFLKYGGQWYWVSNYSGATKHSPDGNHQSHDRSERVINLCGYFVQRDMKSGLCLSCATGLKPALNKNGKERTYNGAPVYDVIFDDEQMMRQLPAFVKANDEEMERLRNMGVEEKTVGLDDFFEKKSAKNLHGSK